ncbi:PEP-CTERM sorting domain-containing protein [Haliea sp.]
MIYRAISAVLSAAIATGVAHASPLYFEGFETDTGDWVGASRVASGTGGIASASGGFHARSAATGDPNTPFHYFGDGSYGTRSFTSPFTAAIDFYLDVGGSWSNDTRFDYTVALKKPDEGFLRDFVFNVGFYDSDDADGPGANTDRFIISASNNSGRANTYPKNPGKSPVAIDTTGWYTFQHSFFDNGGTLGADLSILDAGGSLVNSWSIGTDPIGDFGGEGYGWIAQNEFAGLAFDNSRLSLTADEASVPVPGTLTLIGLGLAGLGWTRRRKV